MIKPEENHGDEVILCNQSTCNEVEKAYEKFYSTASPGFSAEMVEGKMTEWYHEEGCQAVCLPLFKLQCKRIEGNE